jgi:hypothetical protein
MGGKSCPVTSDKESHKQAPCWYSNEGKMQRMALAPQGELLAAGDTLGHLLLVDAAVVALLRV